MAAIIPVAPRTPTSKRIRWSHCNPQDPGLFPIDEFLEYTKDHAKAPRTPTIAKVKNATSNQVPGHEVSIEALQPNEPGGVAMQREGIRIGAVNGISKKPLRRPSFQNLEATSSDFELSPRSVPILAQLSPHRSRGPGMEQGSIRARVHLQGSATFHSY